MNIRQNMQDASAITTSAVHNYGDGHAYIAEVRPILEAKDRDDLVATSMALGQAAATMCVALSKATGNEPDAVMRAFGIEWTLSLEGDED